VVEREGEVNEELITIRLGGVIFLDDIVNVGDGRADEQSKDKGKDVIVGCPQIDVDGIEDAEQRESPGDTVNDSTFAFGEELVDDGAEEKDVNQSPDEERPWCGGDVCLLAIVVNGGWGGYCVNV